MIIRPANSLSLHHAAPSLSCTFQQFSPNSLWKVRRAKKFTKRECSAASASHIASRLHSARFVRDDPPWAPTSQHIAANIVGLHVAYMYLQEYRQGDFTKLVPDVFAAERFGVSNATVGHL